MSPLNVCPARTSCRITKAATVAAATPRMHSQCDTPRPSFAPNSPTTIDAATAALIVPPEASLRDAPPEEGERLGTSSWRLLRLRGGRRLAGQVHQPHALLCPHLHLRARSLILRRLALTVRERDGRDDGD